MSSHNKNAVFLSAARNYDSSIRIASISESHIHVTHSDKSHSTVASHSRYMTRDTRVNRGDMNFNTRGSTRGASIFSRITSNTRCFSKCILMIHDNRPASNL